MGNKPNMTSSALADNDKKDIYKLQVVECPPTPGVLLASNHVVSSRKSWSARILARKSGLRQCQKIFTLWRKATAGFSEIA